MKKIFFVWLILLLFTILGLQAQDYNLKLIVYPDIQFPGKDIVIKPDNGYSISKFISLKWDGEIKPIVKTNNTDSIVVVIPSDASPGSHKIEVIDILLEQSGIVNINVLPINSEDSVVNGYDPDPHTQNGLPINSGKNPEGKLTKKEIFNPSGGTNNIPFINCDSLHNIDGKFTKPIVSNRSEWSGITPLKGRFSYLYIDYCETKRTMYLLNDWIWGTGDYDSTSCYNRFELITGGGSENWQIWIYHSILRGIRILRNGIDVSNDTNFVLGGKSGFFSSPNLDSAHTIYEFGLHVQSGIFYMPAQCDPYRPPSGGVSVKTFCDDNGYGIVQDPDFYSGEFGNGGTRLRNHDRYIPLSGVAGLVVDPISFKGSLKSNGCKGPHKIDGQFTKFNDGSFEWQNSKPAKGKYSNLFADFCDGILYILNDWFLGSLEPDEGNCYNLFELYTAGGKEHWGIYVYHNINKGIRVFRNGSEVSNDTNIVKGGVFNFQKSLLAEDTANTIYEFGIKAEEGDWLLYLCDPGPASFCDDYPESAPRYFNSGIGSRKIDENNSPIYTNYINAIYNDTLKIGIGTLNNMSDWFGRRFRATINYDINLFYPLLTTKNQNQNLLLDSVFYYILEPGKLIVEGESTNNFSSNGDLFTIEGIVLAGYDSISRVTGTIEIGNRNTYLRKAIIPQLLISSRSNCNSTNSLVKNINNVISNLILSPNPVNSSSKLLNLSFDLLDDQLIQFRIYNFFGGEIQIDNTAKLFKGYHKVALDLMNLPCGYYLLNAKSNNGNCFKSFIIAE